MDYRNEYLYGSHAAPSRRTILEDAFHADAQHPARRVIFEIGMLLLPAIAATLVVGLVVLSTVL